MEKKAKISICKKCGYGIPVRAESCRICTTPAEKEKEIKLQIKKINTEQKSAAGKKPKLTQKKPAKASLSGAKTISRKPKATCAGKRRTKSVRFPK